MNSFVIEWSGPYDDDEISDINESNGLYLITGFQKFKRNHVIQYCGITERNFRKRFNDLDHKKELVTRERKYWLGNIRSNTTIVRKDLELVESLIVFFWQPELNVHKKRTPPSPTVIINRWYNKEKNLRRKIMYEAQRLHDVIFWDGESLHLSDSLKVY